MTAAAEAHLVERARRGERAALESLIEPLRRLLHEDFFDAVRRAEERPD